MSESTAERLQRSLADRYRIECELGRGGMATVFLAHDLRHDRKVALKVLDPETAPVAPARFQREIRFAARLRERALRAYAWVAGMWSNADPELQPYVRKARGGLARLTAEKP